MLGVKTRVLGGEQSRTAHMLCYSRAAQAAGVAAVAHMDTDEAAVEGVAEE